MTNIEHNQELTKRFIEAKPLANIGIVGWTTFDQETTDAVMEALLGEQG